MIKKLILAAGCLAVILSVLYFVLRKDTQQQIDDFIRSAAEYEQKEDWNTAIICLRNVLQLSPMRGDIHARLANDYARVEDYQECLKHYEAALRYGMKSEGFLRNYAEFCEKIGAADYIEKPARELLKIAPRDPEAQYWLAASVQDKDPLTAISYAEDSLKNQPTVKCFLLLAELYLQREETDKALNILQKGIAKYPQEAQIYSGLASIEAHQDKIGDAKSHIEKALALADAGNGKDTIPVYTVATAVFKRLGDTSRCVELYRKLINLAPDNVRFQISLAKLYLEMPEQGNNALSLLQGALEVHPEEDALQLTYIEALIHLKKYGQAGEVLEALPADVKQSPSGAYMKGLLLMQNGHYWQAEPYLLKAADAFRRNNSVNLALGLCYQHMNLLESAQNRFEAVLRNAPSQPEALLGSAEVALQRGDLASAEEHARALHVTGYKRQEAEEILNRCSLNNNIDTANTAEMAADDTPSELRLSFARALATDRKFEQALAIIDEVLAKNPENTGAILLKTMTLNASGKEDEGLGFLGQQAAQQADNEKIVTTYANMLLTKDQPAKAMEVLHALTHRLPKSAPAHSALGRILFLTGKREQALASFLVAAELAPEDFERRKEVIACYSELGKLNEAHEEVRLARKQFGNTLPLMALEGQLLLKEKRSDEAMACFRAITARWPDQPEGHLLAGAALNNTGDISAALDEFEAARRIAPSNAQVLSHLRDAYLKAGLYAKALEETRALQRMRQNSLQNKHSLAISLAATGEQAQALDVLEELADENPTAAEYLLQIAALRANAGDRDGALEAVEKALDVDTSPAVIQAACQTYWELKDFAKALELIEHETKKSESLYHSLLAQHYAYAGEQELAEEHLRRLLVLDPQNAWTHCRLADLFFKDAAKYSEAAKWYRKALAINSDMTYAKRQLARLESARGNFGQAEKILEDLLKKSPNDHLAQAGMVEIAIARMKRYRSIENENAARERAETFVTHNNRNAHAHYLMAVIQLLSRQPDKTGARRSIERALQLHSNSEQALLLRIRLAMQDGMHDMAQSDCRRLLKLQPQNIEAALLLGEALEQTGAPAKSYEHLLDQYPMNPAVQIVAGLAVAGTAPERAGKIVQAALAQNDWRLAEWYATHLLKNGDCSRAIEAVTPFTEKGNIEAKRLLVDALKMSGKLSRALTIQQELYESSQAFADLQREAMLLVSARKADEALAVLNKEVQRHPKNIEAKLLLAKIHGQFGRYQQAVDQAENILTEDPHNEQARLTLATACLMKKQYNKAAQEYEKVLQQNPNNDQAANNLSYIYAEHLGRVNEAHRIILPVVQRNPNLPAVQDTYGLVLLRMNNLRDAKAAFEQAVELQPDAALLNYHLGALYQQLEDDTKARHYLEKALELDPRFEKAAEARRMLENLP